MKKKTRLKPGKLVPQPHGGAIMQGGVYPNTGRPRRAIRRKALAELADRGVETLSGILDADGKPRDQIAAIGELRALSTLGRERGIPTRIVQDRLIKTIRLLRETLEPDTVEPLIQKLAQVWR